MTRRRSRPLTAVGPLAPSGLSTTPAEVLRCDAERDADLRAERWLLVCEAVIILAIALVVAALQAVSA
jgi:hypothetical protein